MNYKKWLNILVVGTLFLTGCDNQNKDTQAKGKEKIIIATSGAPSPFTTVDKKGELMGYDIEVVKAIFANLPQYEISFEITEFPSVLAGLDSQRYQVGANNFAMNEKRKEKYFYSDPIFKNQYAIAVATKNNNIKQFTDLNGKSTEVTPGLNYATALELYNEQHPNNPVKIVYSEADLLPVLQHVETGQYDFQLIDKVMLSQLITEYNLNLKIIELNQDDTDRIGSPYSYLLISKDAKGEQLIKDINQGIQQIINNGKLSKISEHYFGTDYSPK
ncbi:amino acid ABC transporter substrate-binding protein [Gilliamella sp. Choc5-1]|uniref:transporter substrate-binding domain-containing protein n=1 Tax=Gilliamella sp. Choc5-1 TaxID=3120238 RepID=UPI00080E68B8|nr:transporter substrate-binding domain-containing protein [Gilliamella apicola]OCG44582.1 amino acid ABC transporter substrate-binding protein [Gilliamella apicola]